MNSDDRVYRDAIKKLKDLFRDARERGDFDPSACALATATPDGLPSVRTVNAARLAESGVTFFANLESGKGHQLRSNPHAALCFLWPLLKYQVIVEGSVAQLPADEAQRLWRSVPREYGLAHWASDQTNPVGAETSLRERVSSARKEFDADRVPLPPSWGAFEVRPTRIEFWPIGWDRLRPRERYLFSQGAWAVSKEQP